MGPSDLTSELGALPPTPSVSPADRQSARPEAEGKKRLRARPEDQESRGDDQDNASDDLAIEPGERTRHQLDDLA